MTEAATLSGEEDCPICYEPLKENVLCTPCGHHFHKLYLRALVLGWLNTLQGALGSQ